MSRALFLTLFLYVLLCRGFAQPFSQSQSLSQMSIFKWTGENGLVSNNITSAIQARSGFIWITTYNGIMRFDGVSVEVYDRNNLPFLLTDAFYRVYEDKQGILWFASQGSGIIKYTNGKFETFLPNELPKSIRCLQIEEDGSMWVGTNNQGLFHVTKNVATKIDDPLLADITVLDIERQNDILWIATHGGGLVKFQNKNFTQYTTSDGLASDGINALHLTQGGALFVGTTAGLNEIREDKFTTHPWMPNPVNYITSDKQGRIWIGAENGLERFDPVSNTHEFLNEDGLSMGRINFVSLDIDGNLWISTERNGLILAKETGILNITTRQGLSMDRVNVISESPDHRFYIGTDGGFVNMYSHGTIQQIHTKTKLTDIRDICIDKNNTLWVASYQGVLKITTTQEKLLTEKDGLPARDIRRILLDSNGNLWFGSRSAGIVKMKDKQVLARYHINQGLLSNYILALEEDSKGNIYVGTHSGGLTIIKPDGTSQTYSLSQDNSGILIFNVHISTNGSVWLVCNTGLFNFDGKKFNSLRMDRTNKGETYFDWIEDKEGNVWITSNVGVIKINKADIQKYIQGEIDRLPTRLIDKQDGMKNKECTGATHSLLSSTGKLWVPTIGGISVIYPEKIQKTTVLPKVYINRLTTDTRSYTDSLVVQPGNLRYVFNYTAISFISPSKIKFRYKLSDVDPQWVDAGTKRSVEYTNLAPGKYTFSVMASNNNTDWSPQSEIEISVLPLFYQTIWFYMLCVLFVMVAFYSVYKWRLHVVEKSNKELRKVNSELDKFVYSASHDLRAPLASILGLVAIARLDDGKEIEHHLSMIEKSIKKLDGFINDIIDFSRNARVEIIKEEIEFETLIHDVMDELKYLDESNRISRIVRVTGQGSFFSDPRRLKIILSNLIANAFKYHLPKKESPFIEVKVERSTENANIMVIDNGSGIPVEQLDKIFNMFFRGNVASKGSGLGLYIVKETVEKIEGTITVVSSPGNGSTFTINLPSLKKFVD
jgi:ligand-binding sensor domain-containing protein/two-component sensor histidine kinase